MFVTRTSLILDFNRNYQAAVNEDNAKGHDHRDGPADSDPRDGFLSQQQEGLTVQTVYSSEVNGSQEVRQIFSRELDSTGETVYVSKKTYADETAQKNVGALSNSYEEISLAPTYEDSWFAANGQHLQSGHPDVKREPRTAEHYGKTFSILDKEFETLWRVAE